MNSREVRALYTNQTVRVYQAYSPEIAQAAVNAGKLVEPFRRNRATWIKPSFLWMMYRSGWATKDGQERVLAIDISRAGFEWALANAELSTWDPDTHESESNWKERHALAPVIVQWDPERNIALEKLSCRTIQIGLKPPRAVALYVDEWTKGIVDITTFVRELDQLRQIDREAAFSLLPKETTYPLAANVARAIGIAG